MRAPCCRVSTTSSQARCFPCRASRACRAPRASSSGIGFTSAARRSSASRRRRSSRSDSWWPCAQMSSITCSGSSPGRLGLLADQRLDLVVGDLDPGLVGDRLERELARDRPRRLALHLRDQLLRRLARDLRGRSSARCPRRSSERTKPVEQLAGARLDERPGGLDVRRVDERVDGGGAEGGVDLLLDLPRARAPRCRRAARRACRTRSRSAPARRRAPAAPSP